MTHLSNEQFEDILQGAVSEGDHLARCELCKAQLAERRAMRSRLRSAFATVHVSAGLLERIRSKAQRSTMVREQAGILPAKGKIFQFSRWAIPLAAMAAMFLIGVPTIIFFTRSQPASAATAELFQVYQHSLSPHTELYSDADPASLAEFLKNKLGFKPAFPRLGAGMSIRGCCVTHFRNKLVGSYVVDTPRGVISVIVVPESPESLGMKDTLRRGEHLYMAGSFAKCNMVALELGGYTYCAVGEVPRELLANLLEKLVW